MKYKAIFERNQEREVLGTFNNKKTAIDKLIERGEDDYCLDKKEIRIAALEERGFCLCGCGPSLLMIEEIE